MSLLPAAIAGERKEQAIMEGMTAIRLDGMQQVKDGLTTPGRSSVMSLLSSDFRPVKLLIIPVFSYC